MRVLVGISAPSNTTIRDATDKLYGASYFISIWVWELVSCPSRFCEVVRNTPNSNDRRSSVRTH